MGKKGASSWLAAVKRAFRSPSTDPERKSSTTLWQREELEQEEEQKKREKRRWLFWKSSSHDHQTPPTGQQQTQAKTISPTAPPGGAPTDEQRHAIAVAVATAAAAEAAVKTAQAVVEVARLTRPSSSFVREHFAAVVIQTAFRGYLARRALRALRGLVRLQALVRGHSVRKQANMTLRCIEALVRAQARVRDQRVRVSQQGYSSKSSSSCDANLREPSCLNETLPERNSMSRDGSYVEDHCVDHPRNIDGIRASRTEAALKREKTLAYGIPQQIWRSDWNLLSSMSIVEEHEDDSVGAEEEQRVATWLDRSTLSRASWDHSCGNWGRRASTDQKGPIRTLEIDTARHSCTNPTPNSRKPHQALPLYPHAASPIQHLSFNHVQHSLATPSPVKTRPLQVPSASPRYGRDETASFCSPRTPSAYHHYGFPGAGLRHHHGAGTAMPNYMVATESAKARLRSQSTPRRRPGTPERQREHCMASAKKRLSFPAPDPCGGELGYSQMSLRTPSFKSTIGRLGMERRSTVSSCTESPPGEESPSSTTHLRRWLMARQGQG